MRTVRVAEAEGAVLDWLVAKANNDLHPVGNVRVLDEKVFSIEAGDYERSDRWQQYNPSTDWSQGGPIIEREQITLLRCFAKWRAEKEDSEGDTAWAEDGPTMLVAGMRCFVASKLGEIVEVPEELK